MKTTDAIALLAAINYFKVYYPSRWVTPPEKRLSYRGKRSDEISSRKKAVLFIRKFHWFKSAT